MHDEMRVMALPLFPAHMRSQNSHSGCSPELMSVCSPASSGSWKKRFTGVVKDGRRPTHCAARGFRGRIAAKAFLSPMPASWLSLLRVYGKLPGNCTQTGTATCLQSSPVSRRRSRCRARSALLSNASVCCRPTSSSVSEDRNSALQVRRVCPDGGSVAGTALARRQKTGPISP